MTEVVNYDGARITLTLGGIEQGQYVFVSDAKYRRSLEYVDREHFSVKDYGDGCILKGNGFDGIPLGDDRGEAERFVNFINGFISLAKQAKRSET